MFWKHSVFYGAQAKVCWFPLSIAESRAPSQPLPVLPALSAATVLGIELQGVAESAGGEHFCGSYRNNGFFCVE